MDTLVLEDRVLKKHRFCEPVAKKIFEETVAECNGISVDIFIDRHAKYTRTSDIAQFYEGIDVDAQYREDFDDDNDDWISIDDFKESVVNHIRSWRK